MLLFYNNDTMRLIIHTANLISADWSHMTQAVYMTPILYKKSNSENTCDFESYLVDYLKSYGTKLLDFCEKIKQYDFSPVKVLSIFYNHNIYHNISNSLLCMLHIIGSSGCFCARLS